MPYQDPPSDATRMAQKQACIKEATERFRRASAAIADIVPTDRDVEAWRDWFRRSATAAAPRMVEWSVVNNLADWHGSADASAIADDLPSDVTPPDRPPHSDVDNVIDRLSRDRVSRSDRGRMGDALGKADARADGHKAGAGEAFGRIAGR